MLRVLIFVVFPLMLAVYALVDCIQTPEAEVRGLPKIGWVVLIVLIGVVGPATWLIAGKDRSGRGGPAWSGGAGAGYPDRERPTRRVVAPDDDPDFLRKLNTRDARHEEMLEQWERDLRRREGDLRGEPHQPDIPGDDGADGGDKPRS